MATTFERRQGGTADQRDRIASYLQRSGLANRRPRVVPLTGDASDRRYFRVLIPDGPSIVLSLHAEPFTFETLPFVNVARLLEQMPVPIPRVLGHADDIGGGRAEMRLERDVAQILEREHADGPSIVLSLHAEPFTFETLPFVNVARLLEQMPVPIPRVLGHADDIGVLALEDLGDVTLQAHLGAAPAEHAALYRQAVGFIATLQRRGEDLVSPAFLPYSVAFDVEKLTWELDFFVKHFLEGYRGLAIAPGLRAALRTELNEIARELAAEPRVLCHRDYHSRNLMICQGRLYIIDFQDARMGPDTYDLVSLLRDSYVDLPDQTVDELIAYFLALKGETESEPGFRDRFDIMALQRNLKALGTFGYQTTARRNTVYIQYIPRTLRYVKQNLDRTARFGALQPLLAELVDELR